MDLISALEGLVPELEAGLAQAADLDALEALRVDVLGRKGRIAQIMSQLPGLAPESRPAVGQKANSVKERCNALFEQRKAALEAGREAAALKRFDPSIPGRAPWRGSLHPTTLVMEEICGVFKGLGFDVASGPEVEIDYYNFEALNMPAGTSHARDMQDTLYITDKVLMRTHTSPVQVRTMLTRKPPVAVVVPGKVYRRDSDLTHTPMFHQIEGLLVGQGVSLAHLRGTLTAFVRAVFGAATEVRFRPSFFPFTEPSAEVDISCCMCGGKGTSTASPAGCARPRAGWRFWAAAWWTRRFFEAVGYPADSTGFAFGMGVERVTVILKYGIGDLHVF